MAKTSEILYSSESHSWQTPTDLVEMILNCMEIDSFDFDAACEDTNIPSKLYCMENGVYTKDLKLFADTDGLTTDWHGNVFLNPPYGNLLKKFIEKCSQYNNSKNTSAIVLLPVRTENAYWHDHVLRSQFVYFFQGKLTFYQDGVRANSNCTFATCLAFFGKDHQKFIENWKKFNYSEIYKGTFVKIDKSRKLIKRSKNV